MGRLINLVSRQPNRPNSSATIRSALATAASQHSSDRLF